MRGFLLALLAGAAGGGLGQVPADATLGFHYERAGVPVPSYSFTVHADGSGSYVAPPAVMRAFVAQVVSAPPANGDVTSALMISPELRAKMFELAKATKGLRGCASKAKVADTGLKMLTYTGADGTVTCSYNFSESKPVAALTEIFQGMALALDAGRELERKERFDRLGLDAEMSNLVSAVKEGRAVGLGNIAPILQGLVDDQQVLERVRNAAQKLLGMAAAGK